MFAIIFCFHDKIGSMGEDKDPEDLSILNTGTFFHFRCDKYNSLLPLLRNSFSLIDPIVFCRFYKMIFESIALFWKYFNKLQGRPKPGNLSLRNMKSLQPPILIQKTAFPTTKIEEDKPTTT